jgi:tol-pal system protein YbgF
MRARDRGLRRFFAVAAAAMATACVHDKGEGQLVWLQAGLEKEFPDHGSVSGLDLSGKQAEGSPTHASTSPPVAKETLLAPVPPRPSPSVAPVPAEEPVIRVAGGGHHVELTLAPAPTADGSAKTEYDHAIVLLNAGDYDHALAALSAFLARWPDDPRAETAVYWKAECYFARGEIVAAADEYQASLARFPQGSRAADSLLRLGSCADKLGNTEKSRAYYERLAHDFPKSDAARRIPRPHVAS